LSRSCDGWRRDPSIALHVITPHSIEDADADDEDGSTAALLPSTAAKIMDATARMAPQMWAFLGSAAAAAVAAGCALVGAWSWAGVALLLAVSGGVAARIAAQRAPAPMPHWMRWVLFLPRAFHSVERLQALLRPRPGERLLEIGPGVGIHALPIAAALAPDGVLEVIDVQPAMIDDLRARATQAGIRNIQGCVGDARHLPYPDASFDGAYLISVLGEIGDQASALRELRRVLKADGRLVVGEIIVDPDFISPPDLRKRLGAAGFTFERRLGPSVAYLASFRVSS
jgi:predicted O-methyltransferase YrrM